MLMAGFISCESQTSGWDWGTAMSYVVAAPESLVAADVSGIGSAVRAANTAAAGSTTQVLAAAGDEVSAAISGLFANYARGFQALSAQGALFHAEFVHALSSGARGYAAAEAANAAPLQTVEQGILGAINAPTNAVLSRPLIGNGSNDAAGTGQAGGAGGILWGNGGNGGSGAATAEQAEQAATAATASAPPAPTATAATAARAVKPATAAPESPAPRRPVATEATAAKAATAARRARAPASLAPAARVASAATAGPAEMPRPSAMSTAAPAAARGPETARGCRRTASGASW